MNRYYLTFDNVVHLWWRVYIISPVTSTYYVTCDDEHVLTHLWRAHIISPVSHLDAVSFLFLLSFLLLPLRLLALLFFWVDVLEPTQFHVFFERPEWIWVTRHHHIPACHKVHRCGSLNVQRTSVTLMPVFIHRVPKKTCDYIFYNNFNNNCPITIIFGIVSSKCMCHRKMVSFPTSPIYWNYLTLGNHRTRKMTNFAASNILFCK